MFYMRNQFVLEYIKNLKSLYKLEYHFLISAPVGLNKYNNLDLNKEVENFYFQISMTQRLVGLHKNNIETKKIK